MNVSSASSINKKKKNYLKILSGVIIFCIFIFVLNIFSFQIKNYFYLLSFPVQKTFFTAGESLSGIVNPFLNIYNLAKENENLKKENQNLLSQISLLQATGEGIQASFDFFAACQEKNFTTVMASVIGLDGQDIISINKGSSEGILEGMPVVSQQGVVFGKILAVYKNFSKVMLISNKNSVIDVKIQQKTADPLTPEINGVVKGNGGFSIFLDLVQVDQEIKEGDILITSSLEKVFPKDLLVGKITKIEKNDQKPFQQAKIEQFFEVKSADNLFVITNYKQEN